MLAKRKSFSWLLQKQKECINVSELYNPDKWMDRCDIIERPNYYHIKPGNSKSACNKDINTIYCNHEIQYILGGKISDNNGTS